MQAPTMSTTGALYLGRPVVLRAGHSRPRANALLQSGRRQALHVVNIAAAPPAPQRAPGQEEGIPRPAYVDETGYGRAAPPPFTLADIKAAVPAHCWKKSTWRSMAFLARDVGVVAALAVGAYTLNAWWAWPLYWVAQGTMFWALFVVGHDCGHQSFSSNKTLNNLVGNITHSSILVPYHGWRISHRTHHANHGHVENDESWHPVSKRIYNQMESMAKIGRLAFPLPLFAYPFYLWQRSPGKTGSHYDPKCDLFVPQEAPMIRTSNAFMLGMLAILGACTYALGPLAMFNLYFIPYVINVVWLDAVTYLHHHGPHDENEKIPWYRGEEWSYLRGGLSTIDRDFGIFNHIHHDIGTHVLHHLFPQIPHYHLVEATEAVKPVFGNYYREPEPSPGPIPTHLFKPLMRSFAQDHYVEDEGDIVYYKTDPKLNHLASGSDV
uniref:Omega-3 fatty acid desaturase n=2 Tax=Lobosphaera incisa TaxID=312850 RepID=B2ZFX8_9CHLO|nr:omega-3 fatty acid desaturase [Lobosphaera incisa]AGZ87952.1 plastid omega-3 fatty acid desaturase [Lobosphaera incisa H4301]ART29444.1 omega-3 fatty acid desaturase [Lobosphaera incisa]